MQQRLLAIALPFLLIGLHCSSALAQQRYLTDAELQQLLPEIRSQAESYRSIGAVRSRSSSEVAELNTFIQPWAVFDPALASFLGEWSGWEESLMIYPSNQRGTVCILVTGIEYEDLSIGTISGDRIYTNNGDVIIRDGDVLASTFRAEDGAPVSVPFFSPTPLIDPVQYNGYTSQDNQSRVLEGFNAANCTVMPPSDQQFSF